MTQCQVIGKTLRAQHSTWETNNVIPQQLQPTQFRAKFVIRWKLLALIFQLGKDKTSSGLHKFCSPLVHNFIPFLKAKITEGKTKTLPLLYCLATQGMLFYYCHKGLAQVINFLMVLVDDIDTEMMGFEEGEGKGTLCFFVKPGIYPLKTAFKEENNIMFTKSNIWNLENSRNKGCLCHWNWALFCYEGYNLGLHHCICIFYHRAPFYPVHRMDSAYGTSISLQF